MQVQCKNCNMWNMIEKTHKTCPCCLENYKENGVDVIEVYTKEEEIRLQVYNEKYEKTACFFITGAAFSLLIAMIMGLGFEVARIQIGVISLFFSFSFMMFGFRYSWIKRKEYRDKLWLRNIKY